MCPVCFPFLILIPLAVLIGYFHKPTGLWLRRIAEKWHKKLSEYISIKGEK